MEAQKLCFIIMPIGDDGTELRKRFDEVYNYLIRPAVSDSKCGYQCILRADEVRMPQ